ncbi:hypothetical protein HK102_005456, partial [Quaeritorhiza haematococci]
TADFKAKRTMYTALITVHKISALEQTSLAKSRKTAPQIHNVDYIKNITEIGAAAALAFGEAPCPSESGNPSAGCALHDCLLELSQRLLQDL